VNARAAAAARAALLLAIISCGARQRPASVPVLVLRTHESGAELMVPPGWAFAIDAHRASAASPDGGERLSVQLTALPPDRARRREPDRWECEEGTLVAPGPYYGTCIQEIGDVAITLSTVSRQPSLPRVREIAESVHGFVYQPPSEDRFADADCGAALARMRRCVVGGTMLEGDRGALLDMLDSKTLACDDIVRGYRETVRELGCPPPPPAP
jgi:hypothetical protein